MDNVLIVVDDLEAASACLPTLDLEGETTVEGPSVDRLAWLDGVRCLRKGNPGAYLDRKAVHRVGSWADSAFQRAHDET